MTPKLMCHYQDVPHERKHLSFDLDVYIYRLFNLLRCIIQQNGQPRSGDVEHPRRDGSSSRQIGPIHTPMTVAEQFKESWLTAIIGSILFAAGMCLLFWNEVGCF